MFRLSFWHSLLNLCHDFWNLFYIMKLSIWMKFCTRFKSCPVSDSELLDWKSKQTYQVLFLKTSGCLLFRVCFERLMLLFPQKKSEKLLCENWQFSDFFSKGKKSKVAFSAMFLNHFLFIIKNDIFIDCKNNFVTILLVCDSVIRTIRQSMNDFRRPTKILW